MFKIILGLQELVLEFINFRKELDPVMTLTHLLLGQGRILFSSSVERLAVWIKGTRQEHSQNCFT